MEKKENKATNLDEMPIVLQAKDIVKITGLSLPMAYALMRRKGFPSFKLSRKRIAVSKAAFKLWMEEQAKNGLTV